MEDKNIERGAKETEQVYSLTKPKKIYGILCLGPVLDGKGGGLEANWEGNRNEGGAKRGPREGGPTLVR